MRAASSSAAASAWSAGAARWIKPRRVGRSRALLAAADTADPVMRFTACAKSVRHLLDDPALPEELLPPDWPGAELQKAHIDYNRSFIETRRMLAATD